MTFLGGFFLGGGGKNGQKLPETCDYKILDPQNSLFSIKDKKIYIYKM